jgi:hypothetical protein
MGRLREVLHDIHAFNTGQNERKKQYIDKLNSQEQNAQRDPFLKRF